MKQQDIKDAGFNFFKNREGRLSLHKDYTFQCEVEQSKDKFRVFPKFNPSKDYPFTKDINILIQQINDYTSSIEYPQHRNPDFRKGIMEEHIILSKIKDLGYYEYSGFGDPYANLSIKGLYENKIPFCQVMPNIDIDKLTANPTLYIGDSIFIDYEKKDLIGNEKPILNQILSSLLINWLLIASQSITNIESLSKEISKYDFDGDVKKIKNLDIETIDSYKDKVVSVLEDMLNKLKKQ